MFEIVSLLFSLRISQRQRSVLKSQVILSGRAQSSEVHLWGREAGPAHVNIPNSSVWEYLKNLFDIHLLNT